LKNVPYDKVEQTIAETMEVVMLSEFQYKMTKNLSGGMKRKLSLAMAIVS